MKNILPGTSTVILWVGLLASVLSGCKDLVTVMVMDEKGKPLELQLTPEQLKYLATSRDSVVPVAEFTYFREDNDPNCIREPHEEVYNRKFSENFNWSNQDWDCINAWSRGTRITRTFDATYSPQKQKDFPSRRITRRGKQ